MMDTECSMLDVQSVWQRAFQTLFFNYENDDKDEKQTTERFKVMTHGLR